MATAVGSTVQYVSAQYVFSHILFCREWGLDLFLFKAKERIL